jgi:hypothetical protein
MVCGKALLLADAFGEFVWVVGVDEGDASGAEFFGG